jgi:hypothetical protein
MREYLRAANHLPRSLLHPFARYRISFCTQGLRRISESFAAAHFWFFDNVRKISELRDWHTGLKPVRHHSGPRAGVRIET